MGLDSASLSVMLSMSNSTASSSYSAPANAGAAVAALKAAQKAGAETKGIAAEKKDPVTITALKQFDNAVAKVKDVKSALRDPRILAVLLPAFGLQDQKDYPGLVQKALMADPKDTKGLLASLDARFKTAATTLDLKAKGVAAFQDASLMTTLKNAYIQYQYQQGLDEKNAGMSDALYFIKNAGNQTNVYNILGNKVLRRVVTGALGLPNQIAIQPVETQARAVTARLDLKKLQDPKQVQKLAERYVMSVAGQTTNTVSSPLLSLLA